MTQRQITISLTHVTCYRSYSINHIKRRNFK